MRASAQEIRLLSILRKEFPRLAESYIRNLGDLACEKCPKLEWYDDDSGHLFFRFNLDLPALFQLSEPLSRFMAYKKYILPIGQERNFYASLGLVPVYFSNLHRISCINLWGSQASDFFAPYSRPLRGEENIARRFNPVISKPSQFSSMNFILKGGALDDDIPQIFREAISNYFTYAFWSLPKPGFSCSAHIIHSRDHVNHILKVAKGLYIIKKIHKPRVEWLAPYYSAWVQRVTLEVPTKRKGSKTFWAYMARDIVRKIEQESGPKGYSHLFINGLIYEFKDKVHSPHGLRLLSVISNFPSTDVEIFKTLTGMAIAHQFHSRPESFGLVGTVDELRKAVEKNYRLCAPRITGSSTLFSLLGGPIEYIFEELFPMAVFQDEIVYFVHPIILSMLLKLGRDDILERRDAETLCRLTQLLEKARTIRTQTQLNSLRFTDEAEHLRKSGIYFSELKSIILSVRRWIRLSKLLYKYF